MYPIRWNATPKAHCNAMQILSNAPKPNATKQSSLTLPTPSSSNTTTNTASNTTPPTSCLPTYHPGGFSPLFDDLGGV